MLNTLVNINISNEVILIVSCVILLIVILSTAFIILKNKKKEDKEIDTIISNMVQTRKEETQEEIVDDKTKELEEVLEKMQKDLEATPVDVVETFEKEQEEKAIISYKELVNTLKKGTEEEKTLDVLVDEIKENQEETQEEKKFKNTDFISPIYGKIDEHLEYPTIGTKNNDTDILKELEEFDEKLNQYKLEDYLEEFNSDNNMEIDSLEKTLDMEPISSEVKKNEEFLQALIEFRENL